MRLFLPASIILQFLSLSEAFQIPRHSLHINNNNRHHHNVNDNVNNIPRYVPTQIQTSINLHIKSNASQYVQHRYHRSLHVASANNEESSPILKPPSPSPSPSPSPVILGSTLPPDIDDADCPEESCILMNFLPDTTKTSLSNSNESNPLSQSTISAATILNPILIIPILTPILAYQTYDDVAGLFNSFIDMLNYKRSWVPVDGGAYQARIIAPAINGIIVPAITILFATLISNTVATLRQRQIDIHTSLNTEAGDLRLLSSMVDSFPTSSQKLKCREYLTQYTARLIAESSENIKFNSVEFQGSTDSEMNGFVFMLNDLCTSGDDDYEDGSCNLDEMGGRSRIPPDPILSQSYGAVVRLNSQRSARITYLQSTFPTLHYGLLGALGGSICLAFLIETNQELLIFLNAIQLRLLWTMLIGTFSALGVVCYDLSGPFRGQYQISNAVYQLMTIRDALRINKDQS